MNDGGRHMACTSCRDRKVKCDGQQPSCQRCSRYSVQCVYIPPAKRSKVDADLGALKERLCQPCPHPSGYNAKSISVQAESVLATRRDDAFSTYPPPVKEVTFDNEAALWPASTSSLSTITATDINGFFQNMGNCASAPLSSFQERNSFPPHDQAAWNLPAITPSNTTDASEIREATSLGRERADSVNQGYNGETLSHWPSEGSTSPSNPAPTTRSTSIDAYEAVPPNVRNDL